MKDQIVLAGYMRIARKSKAAPRRKEVSEVPAPVDTSIHPSPVVGKKPLVEKKPDNYLELLD
jgi:hypothetical protein